MFSGIFWTSDKCEFGSVKLVGVSDIACHRSDIIRFSVQYVLLTGEDFVKPTDMEGRNAVLALNIYICRYFITNNAFAMHYSINR